LVVYFMEGFVFWSPACRRGRRSSVRGGLRDLALAVPTAVVIVARFMWVFPAVYLPRWLSRSLARRDPAPPWQWAFLLSFVGVRGVGEVPIVPPPAALANAIYRAVGVRLTELPMSPARIVAALQAHKG
jgi:NhaP-type Na+/H+ or K+/H+ antiporter